MRLGNDCKSPSNIRKIGFDTECFAQGWLAGMSDCRNQRWNYAAPQSTLFRSVLCMESGCDQTLILGAMRGTMKPANLLIAVVALGSCAPNGNADQEFIDRATRTVADLMRDPESARFREVKIAAFELESGATATAVCGQVNAKNLMGGYIGYTRFHYTELAEVGPFASVREPLEDNRQWDALCQVYCEGADRRVIADAFNEKVDEMLEESARNLQAARDEYNQLVGEGSR